MEHLAVKPGSKTDAGGDFVGGVITHEEEWLGAREIRDV
jgi:hypothetical protein